MLWFALLYGMVTASAGAEMDTINAGIRARIEALRGQPVQELRVALIKSPVREEAVADETARNASLARKPDARCRTYTVSAESCSLPNVRCSPPPTIDAQATLRNLAEAFEEEQRASRAGDNQGSQAL